MLILGGRDEAMHWRGARLFDPRGGRWTFPVGPPDLRSNHTATLLADGTVLVVGGQVTAVPSARGQALRFDPATSAFRASGRVPTTLPEHTATRLADGAVLLVGGAVALRFDPARDRFDPLPASPRQGSAAVRLADGRVLLVGGASPDAVDTPAPAVLFDPRVARFVPVASPAVARRDFIAARLADGRVLIAGGYGLRGTPLASAEVFDPATGRWCDAAPMDSPRASHAAVTLADGRVLVVGGAAEGAAMDRYVRSTEVYGELP